MRGLGLRAAIAATAVAGVLAATGDASAAMDVPSATFTSVNVPGTTAFGASPEDLSRYGYAEQEYYVSGEANRYRIRNAMSDAELVDGGYPYKTRMLVRRPTDPAKFNGTVVVEWYNVTTGQDVDFDYAASREYLLRSGYAIVAVSAQLAGLNPLKTWSPARYGDLSLTAPTTDPAGGSLGSDVLGWDVFSQTIKGLRDPGAINPLSGLNVKRVIANGESQSASRLTSYYNSIDPLHRVVDGTVYYDGAGNLRTDSATKAITVTTEIFGANPGSPAPDNANFRRWDVAGTSHVSLYDVQYADAIVKRDALLRGADGQPDTLTGIIEKSGCAWTPIWSTVRLHHVLNAAFDRMNTWIQGFGAPPSAPRFERDTSVTPAVVRRDANGIALGGIRLADIEYPTAINRTAGNTGAGFFCFITGSHRFLTSQELAARYPDPREYVRNVERVTAKQLSDGFILGPEAAETVADAYKVFDLGTAQGTVGGSVPATLSLTVGAPASFGAFTPGLAKSYTASMAATVISTAGDAALSVADASTVGTGHLVNGSFVLPQALQARAGGAFAAIGGSAAPTTLKTWSGPTSNEAVTISFEQSIAAGDALRTGSYSKTLTFTLSTTQP